MHKVKAGFYCLQRGIPAAVNTRWNLTLGQVKAVFQCDQLKLCHVLEKARHKLLSSTVNEWNLFKEGILKPFGEGTDLTWGGDGHNQLLFLLSCP